MIDLWVVMCEGERVGGRNRVLSVSKATRVKTREDSQR